MMEKQKKQQKKRKWPNQKKLQLLNKAPRTDSPRFLSENAFFRHLHPWTESPRFSVGENKLEKILFFLTILFLPTQLGKHFWPDFAYIYSLKIDYLAPTLYFWDLLVIGLSFFLKDKKINNRAVAVLLIFLLTQALSLMVSSNALAGLFRLEQLFISSLFALYLSSQKFSEITKLIKPALSLAVVFESVLSLAQFLKGGSVGLWILGERSFSLTTASIANFNWFGQVFLRPYATFPHPNVMGAFMVLSLAILYFTWPHTLVMILGSTAGLLSFSRGVILILFLELSFLLKNKLKWLIAILILTVPFIFIRFNSALNFDSLSLIRREELAMVALGQFLNQPVLGVGLNNFINSSSQISISGPSRFLQPVHNIFLLSLAETGLVGFGGFLIFLGYPLWQVKKVQDAAVQIFILSLFGMIIFLGMFDHYFLTLPQGQRLLFLVWGLSLSLIWSKIKKHG